MEAHKRTERRWLYYRIFLEKRLQTRAYTRYNNAPRAAGGLDTRVIGREIYYLPTVDSTNNYAKELARSGCGDGTVIIADQQTQGRGRMGRSWHSADKRVYGCL